MITEGTPSTDDAARLLDRVDAERQQTSRALFLLATKLRGFVHEIIDRLPDDARIVLPTGVVYECKRLTWNGRADNIVRRHTSGAPVLMRNGRALNNDRPRNWTVNGVTFETSSNYLDGDKAILLANERDLGEFWNERTTLLEQTAAFERKRTEHIRNLLDQIPDYEENT
jgi:hypothetical protein